MSSDDFYVVLPSNTETSVFPNNKTSDYEIPLPRALEFGTSTWEVALVEIFYPFTWENICPPFLQVQFGFKDSENIQRYYTVKIENGYYKTVSELVDEINSKRGEYFKGKLFVNPANNQVKIILQEGENIAFHKTMAALLGFPDDIFFSNAWSPRKVIKAPMNADVHASMHNIFIYTNIVKETLVGNGYYPLLRIITTAGEHGMNTSQNFLKPYYHEVAFDRLSSIRLTLCDDQSKPVKFESGKVICKLHFRRKRGHLL